MRTLPTRLLLAAVMLAMVVAPVGGSIHVDAPIDPLLDIPIEAPAKPKTVRVRAAVKAVVKTTTTAECRLSEFTSAEGAALLELIGSVSVECMDDWFFEEMPVSRDDVFSQENMIYIGGAAVERAEEYNSREGRNSLVGKLYVFLYAGFWNYLEHLRFTRSVQYLSTIRSALETFIGSEHFNDEGDEHASMCRTIIKLVSLLRSWGEFFFFDFAELLRSTSLQSDEERGLVSDILKFLQENIERKFRNRDDDYIHSFEAELISLAQTLVDLGADLRTRGSSADEEFNNLTYLLRYIYELSEGRPELLSAVASAVETFVGAECFDGQGDEQVSTCRTAIEFVSLIGWGEIFFFDFAELLGSASLQSDEGWGLASDILKFLKENIERKFENRDDDYISSFEEELISLVEALVDLGTSRRMHESSADEEFRNSAYLLRYILYELSEGRPELLSALKTDLRRLVNYWEGFEDAPGGELGRDFNRYYVSIGIVVYLYRRNYTHLTGLMEEFLKKILPLRYVCGKHVIRSQYNDPEYGGFICETLNDQENLFHEVLDTKRKPLPGNVSESIEIIIFISPDYFKVAYSFGVGTLRTSGIYFNNGGNVDKNIISRAFVGAPDNQPFSATNTTKHEFVHYLDFRYNGYGPDPPWLEGIAEYLSLENDNRYSLDETRKSGLYLGQLLSGGHRNYEYVYTALRFMFERHPEDVAEWLDCIYRGVKKDGEFDSGIRCFQGHSRSIGSSYDGEFAEWLGNATANDNPLPRITRKEPRTYAGNRRAAAVPLLASASGSMRQGFVRIVNESDQTGSVRITAHDDAGNAANPIEVRLGARRAFHFNAGDLENGNAGKGVNEGVGSPGLGDWRLAVESALDARVLSFVRTGDGFLTAMHDVLPGAGEGRLAAYTFNPGRNHNQVSSLRLVNTGANAESVSIEGVDDQGASAGPVSLTLAAGEARTLTAQDLENGASGLTGRLGDGAGKWRLFITAGGSVLGMSLLESPTGHLTNISTGGERLAATVPLLASASGSMRQGFVRIVNESSADGTVRVTAFDDAGNAASPIEIRLGANQAFHFNAGDLENGNANKGIESGIGSPSRGDWRLAVESALDARVLSYVRTGDGFLTAMHDVLPRDGEGRLAAQTFNPGQNRSQVSSLRLVNTGANAESVSISGVDDQGASAGPVSLTLAAGEARTLTAQDLENGASGLTGSLGDGAGKWRLFISAGESVVGMSLLESPTGHLTNISTM